MKRLLLLLAIVLFLFPVFAQAKIVTLSWDESPSNVAGYKIYYCDSFTTLLAGDKNDFNITVEDVGNVLTFQITGLEDYSWQYFAVSAYDSDGNESVFSNAVGSRPLVYEISTNDFTFNGVYLTSGGTIKAEITDPSSLSFTEYRSGGVLIGDLINFDANLFFSDGGSPDPLVNDQSPFRFYARDISTGERISTEKYFFVDYSFKGYADSVAMTKASSYYEFVVEYGERGSGQEGDIATYEVAINSISLSNPEYPPSEMKFKELRETSPDGIAFYPIHDLVIGIEDYVSTPLLRKWKVAKTYEGATVDKDWNEIENPVFYESTKLNLGEDEYVLTITPEMEPNGVFISLVNVYSNGEESVSTVYYYLPGNLTGNVDDGTDIVDVTVDTSDTTLARAMLRARVSSTFLKDYSFEQFERADLDNDGRITTLDYIGVSGYKYSAPIIYYMY